MWVAGVLRVQGLLGSRVGVVGGFGGLALLPLGLLPPAREGTGVWGLGSRGWGGEWEGGGVGGGVGGGGGFGWARSHGRVVGLFWWGRVSPNGGGGLVGAWVGGLLVYRGVPVGFLSGCVQVGGIVGR